MSDLELIRRFRAGDREAFAGLVNRHYAWVYATARRHVGDAHAAADVAQAVFIVLLHKAPTLRADSALAAWLFQVTRFAARKALRAQRRRDFHESRAAAMRTEGDEDQATVTHDAIGPHIDDALSRLPKADRQAVLLRFYQGQTFTAVGEAMGISEEAARKRVTRATERLRTMPSMRDLAMTAPALSAAMMKFPVQAAGVAIPPASAIANSARAPGALAKGAIHMMTTAKIKLIAAMVLAATVVTVPSAIALHAAATAGKPAAASSQPAIAPNPGNPAAAVSQDGPVLPDDLLQIGIADLVGPGIITHGECRVDADSQIATPFLDSIDLKDATLPQAEAKIRDAYRAAKLIVNADISIRRVESGAAPSVRSGPASAGDWVRIDIADLQGPGIISEITDQVNAQGNIGMPMVGSIKVSGMTERQIVKTIALAYRQANFILHAHVWALRITAEQAARVPKERVLDGRDDRPGR